MEVGCIYKISFIGSRYFYYGSTINASKRKREHFGELRRNAHYNQILQRNFNKLGEDNIKFEIIQDNIPIEVLTMVEDIWIGVNCGISYDSKGGMNMQSASKKFIFQPSCGRKWTQEQKLNCRERVKHRKIPIIMLDLQGKFIREFEGIVDAISILKIYRDMISSNLRKITKKCGKYIFIYKSEYNIDKKL